MRKIITITAAALILGLAMPAYASKDDDKSCGGQTGKQMTVSEITSKVKGMGYDVRDVELEDGCYEIKAVDQKGARFELELNPVTGEVIELEKES